MWYKACKDVRDGVRATSRPADPLRACPINHLALVPYCVLLFAAHEYAESCGTTMKLVKYCSPGPLLINAGRVQGARAVHVRRQVAGNRTIPAVLSAEFRCGRPRSTLEGRPKTRKSSGKLRQALVVTPNGRCNRGGMVGSGRHGTSVIIAPGR